MEDTSRLQDQEHTDHQRQCLRSFPQTQTTASHAAQQCDNHETKAGFQMLVPVSRLRKRISNVQLSNYLHPLKSLQIEHIKFVNIFTPITTAEDSHPRSSGRCGVTVPAFRRRELLLGPRVGCCVLMDWYSQSSSSVKELTRIKHNHIREALLCIRSTEIYNL